MPRRERVVELYLAIVIFECAHVIVAHNNILELAFCEEPISTHDGVWYRSECGGKIGIHRIFPFEHIGECAFIGDDGYDKKRCILIHCVDTEKEFSV